MSRILNTFHWLRKYLKEVCLILLARCCSWQSFTLVWFVVAWGREGLSTFLRYALMEWVKRRTMESSNNSNRNTVINYAENSKRWVLSTKRGHKDQNDHFILKLTASPHKCLTFQWKLKIKGNLISKERRHRLATHLITLSDIIRLEMRFQW